MGTTEIFLLAMLIILTLPWLLWRIGGTDYYAPLVIVQIITGVLLGPGILGRAYPDYYRFIFNLQIGTANTVCTSPPAQAGHQGCKRYPTAVSVSKCLGCAASSSSFCRRCPM